MYKLEKLVQRAQKPELVHFCVAMMHSQVKCGDMSAAKFSLKDLTGEGLPNGKGLIDLWLAKCEWADVIIRQAEDT
eukprot:3284973-Alexandrium_andersonii.AAC.1